MLRMRLIFLSPYFTERQHNMIIDPLTVLPTDAGDYKVLYDIHKFEQL